MLALKKLPHLLLPLAGLSLAAADITMDEHNQSWRSTTVWSDDLFPTAENDYFLADLGDNPSILRSTFSGSDNSNSANFPGNSLTIPAGTSFLIKQDLDNTASLNDGAGDLILDGGAINFAPQRRVRDNNPRIRANNLYVTASAGSSISVTGEVKRARLDSTLAGPGDLRISFSSSTALTSNGRSVVFTDVENYTGKITVERGMILDFNADSFFPGGIQISSFADLNVDQILTFPEGGLVDFQNGVIPPGIYSGASLTALGDLYRDNGGTLVVGDITVTTTNDEDNGNLILTNGQGISLREAVTNAQPGARIIFDPSLDGQVIQLDASLGELVIEKSLTIDASDLPDGIIINGGSNGNFVKDANETRCFFINDNERSNRLEVSFNHLTIQNGVFEGDDAGGNIHNRENLTLTNCKILNGRTFGGERSNATGGGIYNEDGNLIMTSCTVSGNQAQGRFANGGGIFSFEGDLTMTSCSISENQTRGEIASGGGIFSNSGTLTMTACTVSGNQTRGIDATGGGIFRRTSSLGETARLVRCTIAENSATNANGGGIINDQGQLIIEHCTILGNSAVEGAGVLSNLGGATSTEISHSIVRDNSGGTDLALKNSNNTNSFVFSGENIIGTLGTSVSGVTPNTAPILLGPLSDNGGPTLTMEPLLGSPAFNAAISSTSTEDQRGFPIDGVPDIGAVELRFLIVTTLNDENDTPVGPELSLREALQDLPSGTTNILFDPSLDGGIISLDAEFGQLTIDQSLTMDASSLPNGITIDGGSNGDDILDANESRCLLIDDGFETRSLVEINNLTILNGIAKGTEGGGNILNRETLILNNCRINRGIAIGADPIPRPSEGGFSFPRSGGGGIFVENGSVTMNSCQMIANKGRVGASGGAAIRANQSTISIVSCLFLENSSVSSGGAIRARETDIFIDTCNISNNSAARGGGIFYEDGNVTILDSSLFNNSASSEGGALQSAGGGSLGGGRLTIEHSTISGNSAGTDGGAFVATRGVMNFSRCTISGNSAGEEGGAGNFRFPIVNFIHCTIIDNSAPLGGGIFSESGGASLSDLITFTSSIIRDNSGGDLRSRAVNLFRSGGNNLVGTGRLGQFSTEEINAAPILLAPLANYGGPTETRPPLPGSPAIDASSGSDATKDQRGFSVTGIPDIGAAELQGDSATAEPILSFFFDSDQDGLTNGLEQAIGSDPAIADFDHPNRLQILGFENGELQTQFGYVDSSIPLKLTRSTDLITFDEVIASSGEELEADTNVPRMIVSDPNPPEGKAFYRLEATLP